MEGGQEICGIYSLIFLGTSLSAELQTAAERRTRQLSAAVRSCCHQINTALLSLPLALLPPASAAPAGSSAGRFTRPEDVCTGGRPRRRCNDTVRVQECCLQGVTQHLEIPNTGFGIFCCVLLVLMLWLHVMLCYTISSCLRSQDENLL